MTEKNKNVFHRKYKKREKAEVRCNKKAEEEEAMRTNFPEKRDTAVHNAVHNVVQKTVHAIQGFILNSNKMLWLKRCNLNVPCYKV